jgi:RHS repeat-associated protein
MSRYRHDYDALGRRSHAIRTGPAFGTESSDIWTYNDRNELTVSERFDDVTVPLESNPAAGLDREYDYDPIGNRTRHKEGTSADVYYCANELNQYDTLDDASSCPPGSPDDTLSDDVDGNLIGGLRNPAGDPLTMEWDAENRLVAVYPTTPGSGDVKLVITYDYMSRRVRKQAFDWDDVGEEWETSASLDRKFVYDSWNVLLEMDGLDSDAIVRKFTWGPDVSGLMGGAAHGSFDSAGGIGGLLAVSTGTTDEDYLYMYDANGNVGQLIAWANDYGNASGTAWHDDRIVAAYEYDAYGDVDTASGNYEGDNPFRFSRKWFDDESALGYWGYRYFSARLGRWLTRDPVEETGGDLLYAYVLNDPTNDIDSFGLQTSQPTSPRSRRASSTPASRPATRPSTRASALRSPNSRRSARPRK